MSWESVYGGNFYFRGPWLVQKRIVCDFCGYRAEQVLAWEHFESKPVGTASAYMRDKHGWARDGDKDKCPHCVKKEKLNANV